MAYKYVIYEQQDHIGIVKLTNPQSRNAHNEAMSADLAAAFGVMESDPDIRVAILTGDPAGNAFSAGADLKDPHTHRVDTVGEGLAAISPKGSLSFDAVADFSKPAIAAINGYAIGWGLLITLCCDILIASDQAQFCVPQAPLGLIPAYGGGLRLARHIGKGNAMRMVLLGERIDAKEAHRMGMVSEVVPHEELMPRALQLAEKLAAMPPLGLKLTKESLLRGLDSPMKEAAYFDLYRSMNAYATEDIREAHNAWREKRKAQFKGR